MNKKFMLAALTLLITWLGAVAFALYTVHKRITGTGTIKTLGIEVYAEPECLTPVTNIDWGLLEPGQTAQKTVYVKNVGNAPVTLTMTTQEWSPSVASQYISVVWNLENAQLQPNNVMQAIFTLTVAVDIQDVTDFSFTIVLQGVG